EVVYMTALCMCKGRPVSGATAPRSKLILLSGWEQEGPSRSSCSLPLGHGILGAQRKQKPFSGVIPRQ
ncbi:hypothetical protein ACFL3Z_02880, partial [Gemmatimonadota bacterium]